MLGKQSLIKADAIERLRLFNEKAGELTMPTRRVGDWGAAVGVTQS